MESKGRSMEINELREKLREYVKGADEPLLEMLYEVAVGYSRDGDSYVFTKEDIELLDQRRNARLAGEEGYDWETAREMITGSK
ncbi:MAG: hypothetical protein JNL72_02275 [Flavipsychrobacter sp.]|nr:hypothetical protein [Flavipsychrobacter sp.]